MFTNTANLKTEKYLSTPYSFYMQNKTKQKQSQESEQLQTENCQKNHKYTHCGKYYRVSGLATLGTANILAQILSHTL